MELPKSMWTRQGLQCAQCGRELWVRVDAMSVMAMIVASCRLADQILIHLVDHHNAVLPEHPPEDTMTQKEFVLAISDLARGALNPIKKEVSPSNPSTTV